VYALANPVASRLVLPARRWPGLWSRPERIGGTPLKVRRPEHFFDPRGQMPETLDLQLTTPPGFTSSRAFREQLTAALSAQEALAASSGAGFLGRARVLSQRPFDRPLSVEQHRQLRPRVAARNKWKRIEALARLKDFLVAHRDALEAWRQGARDVLFPDGTYEMRVAHGAACAGAG